MIPLCTSGVDRAGKMLHLICCQLRLQLAIEYWLILVFIDIKINKRMSLGLLPFLLCWCPTYFIDCPFDTGNHICLCASFCVKVAPVCCGIFLHFLLQYCTTP